MSSNPMVFQSSGFMFLLAHAWQSLCHVVVKPESTEPMACEGIPEAAKGCSSESGILGLKHELNPRLGVSNRCYYATIPTVSVSPSTTIAPQAAPAMIQVRRPPFHAHLNFP